jgi:polar amino acid transport system substrate-binding protein
VASVSGTPGEAWLVAQDIPIIRHYPFAIQAGKVLQKGEVEALLHDKTILSHMIKIYGWTDLAVLPHTVAVHGYAIALPGDSQARAAVNGALLRVVSKPEWKAIVERYIGASD